MKTSKRKKLTRGKKKISKKELRKKRRQAGKIKAKKEQHRRKYPKRRTNKGLFALLASYLMEKVDLRQVLQKTIYFKKPSNSKYSMVDMIISLIALVALGLKRIYHASYYQEETVLAGTLRLKKFPRTHCKFNVIYKNKTIQYNKEQVEK